MTALTYKPVTKRFKSKFDYKEGIYVREDHSYIIDDFNFIKYFSFKLKRNKSLFRLNYMSAYTIGVEHVVYLTNVATYLKQDLEVAP